MSMLLKAALVAAALAAFVLLVPFGGRTLVDRWRASDGPADFRRRTWADMRGVPPPQPPQRAGERAPARSGSPSRAPGTAPTEGHTAADQRALDRLLDEHLGDARGR